MNSINPAHTINISHQKVLRKISPALQDVKKVTTLNTQRYQLNVNGLLETDGLNMLSRF